MSKHIYVPHEEPDDKIKYPKELPPKGKKWWWRPVYTLAVGGAGGYRSTTTCAFCGKGYDGDDVPDRCKCGAVRVEPFGQCGLVDEGYNREEVWA